MVWEMPQVNNIDPQLNLSHDSVGIITIGRLPTDDPKFHLLLAVQNSPLLLMLNTDMTMSILTSPTFHDLQFLWTLTFTIPDPL